MKLILVGILIGGVGTILSVLQPPTIAGPIPLAVGLCCVLVAVLN